MSNMSNKEYTSELGKLWCEVIDSDLRMMEEVKC